MRLNKITQFCFLFVLTTSISSFFYLKGQSQILKENQRRLSVSTASITDMQKQSSNMNLLEENTSEKASNFSAPDKDILPDIRLMEFLFDKLKEGIPLLKTKDI